MLAFNSGYPNGYVFWSISSILALPKHISSGRVRSIIKLPESDWLKCLGSGWICTRVYCGFPISSCCTYFLHFLGASVSSSDLSHRSLFPSAFYLISFSSACVFFAISPSFPPPSPSQHAPVSFQYNWTIQGSCWALAWATHRKDLVKFLISKDGPWPSLFWW